MTSQISQEDQSAIGMHFVVGVSRTSGSPAALRWAYERAKVIGGSVTAVRAWKLPNPPATPSGRPGLSRVERDELLQTEQTRLENDVAEILGADNGVECRLLEGSRRTALVRASAHADMLIIDAPRRGRMSGSMLLAHRLVYAVDCPLMIMPAGHRHGHGLLGR